MFSFRKLLSMDEATTQGTHANQSGRSGVEVRRQLPAAVRENEPTLIPPLPPGGGGSKTRPGDGGNGAYLSL